jgi:lysine-N-methylase
MDNLDRLSPSYAAAFRCLGPACEDPCCSGFDIPVDKPTYAAYQQLPRENVASLISQFVVVNPAGAHDTLYARIVPTPSGACPFFTAERLCGIQASYGPQLLPATCSIYPRALRQVQGRLEGSLSLSCPEAARNVLLDPHFIDTPANLLSGDFRTDSFFRLGANPRSAALEPHLHAIRALLFDILRDRSYTLWQRLAYVGYLCINLSTDRLEVAYVLNAFHKQPYDWQFLPADLKLRLEVILALTNERLADPGSGTRLSNSFWDFIEGIAGNGDDIQTFRHAEEYYHRPFFATAPHILENYLINYIFQHLFPCGREGATTRSVWDEYILMTAQFAWIDTLLIGISAKYKYAFSGEHVVHTVQSFTRAIEHYPEVPSRILEYLRSRNLATIEGMAVLLRP